MIIVRISGGLGNQMFQYAMARSICSARQVELKIDLRSFENYPLHHGYELERVFGIGLANADRIDFSNLLGWRDYPLVLSLMSRRKMKWARGRHIVVEPQFRYWPDVKNVNDESYLYGFWQSEKYFQDTSHVIRNDFKFEQPLFGENAETLERILNCNSISLHIRRADYASDKNTLATHGLCSLEYYRNAVNYVSARVEAPEFFVFSDEISWAKDNLKMDYPCHFVANNNNRTSFNDMHLMSRCGSHIIANSSFSWWGAWLNPNPKKIVIAPRKWFVTDRFDTSDLLPDHWIKL